MGLLSMAGIITKILSYVCVYSVVPTMSRPSNRLLWVRLLFLVAVTAHTMVTLIVSFTIMLTMVSKEKERFCAYGIDVPLFRWRLQVVGW